MTVAELTELRDSAKEAYQKALEASSYSIGSGNANRMLQRQNLLTLKNEWMYWQELLDDAAGTGRRRVKFIVGKRRD